MSTPRSTAAQTAPFSRPLGRRRLLGASGLGAAVALAACTGGGQSAREAESGRADGVVQWWDQFRPLTEAFQQDLFDPYMADNPDITVERQQLEAPDLGQALQIARRSSQLPDVHSIAGLDTSAAALVSDDWFQPISEYVDLDSSEIGDQLFDGIHRFDDEVYSVPMFSGRWHENVPWFNTVLLEEAGVDPDDHPVTWDDLRAHARKVTDATDAHGMFIPGQDPAYLSALVNRLAQSAGAAGGIDWTTGEYIHDTQPFLDAVEFLRSLVDDGVVHPASPSMGPRDARARWAAGEGAIYLWGAWFIGGLMVDEPEAVERGVACWPLPQQGDERHRIYSGPSGGVFWLSTDSGEPQAAAELLERLTTREFQSALASAMDQPPALLDVVDEADVHPAYAQCISYFEDDVLIAPAPEAGDPGVWRAIAEMRDVRPHVGDLVQSMLAGEDVDVEGELRRFNDAISEERERAIAAVSDDVDIDESAWVFSNWDRESDYSREDYDAR